MWKERLLPVSRREAPAGSASKQSSHMHCRSPLQRGEKRGGGEVAPREGASREVRNPASSDLPTLLAPPLRTMLHLTVIRESPQDGWKPDTPKGGK